MEQTGGITQVLACHGKGHKATVWESSSWHITSHPGKAQGGNFWNKPVDNQFHLQHKCSDCANILWGQVHTFLRLHFHALLMCIFNAFLCVSRVLPLKSMGPKTHIDAPKKKVLVVFSTMCSSTKVWTVQMKKMKIFVSHCGTSGSAWSNTWDLCL